MASSDLTHRRFQFYSPSVAARDGSRAKPGIWDITETKRDVAKRSAQNAESFTDVQF